jgi:hypothetical protein
VSLFSLLFKLGIEGTGFNAGLKEAERNAETSADRMSAKFNKAFAKGFIIGGAVGLAHESAQFAVNFAEARKEAEKFAVAMDSDRVNSFGEGLRRLEPIWTQIKSFLATVGDGFNTILIKPLSLALQTFEKAARVIGAFSAGGIDAVLPAVADFERDIAKREQAIIQGQLGTETAKDGGFAGKRMAAEQERQDEAARKAREALEKSSVDQMTDGQKVEYFRRKRASFQGIKPTTVEGRSALTEDIAKIDADIYSASSKDFGRLSNKTVLGASRPDSGSAPEDKAWRDRVAKALEEVVRNTKAMPGT